jgi:cytochrome d ubiquinol oxidase subunit II
VTPVEGAGVVALFAVVLYAIFGGADFGGGVWDFFATGPRAKEQRETITHAIGPVWEANHVWLIFAVVVLFTCFPIAFADLSVGLFPPLTIALVGIVLRGAAFVFRNYAAEEARLSQTLTIVFGISSLIAPFFLGDAAGSLATGRYAWLSPFALSIGLFGVVLCAQVAGVFLLSEVPSGPVHDDFRRRAIRATLALWLAGLIPASIAFMTEPTLIAAFERPYVVTIVALAMLAGILVMILAARGANNAPRIAVGFETIAILAAWFAAQSPDIVPGRYTFLEAASPDATIVAFLIAVACGAIFLIPSLVLLFAIFKRPAPAPPPR